MKEFKKDRQLSVRYLKGIGPKRAAAFESIGIHTIEDLFFFFPRRYEDRSHFSSLAEVIVDDFITIKGTVVAKGIRPTRSIKIFELVVDDGNGRIHCLFFNQPYLMNTFAIDDTVVLFGKVELYKKKLQLNSPEYEILKDDSEVTVHTGRIVPIYPLTEGLTQRSLRKSMKTLIEEYADTVEEIFPPVIMQRHYLLRRKEAFQNIHFPENNFLLERAHFRIVFEEFFEFECKVAQQIKDRSAIKNCFSIKTNEKAHSMFLSALDFSLTKSQEKAIKEIEDDFLKSYPMNRILQGDVGSGKTIIAAFALFLVAHHAFQGAFLIPTEILAEQHYSTVSKLFTALGVSFALLTGNTPPDKKKAIIAQVSKGEINVLMGTHALIQKEVTFSKLGLVIIDEQHKFGVEQREHLLEQTVRPHLLVMTATPIPRTLGLVLYGDLEVSTLRELPFGERGVKTYWITKKKEADVFLKVKEKMREGDQAYIIFPLVEETEKSDLAAATEEYERLKRTVFHEFNVGLVHGRMKKEKKSSVMEQFRAGKIHLLISTTVIEVGIDNPNASIIIIEHAERFGLSQLHQMRGRVGRGKKESFCFLFGEPTTENGKKRLRLMTKTNDGFKIAEEDLYLRGPGDFLGTRQSGLPQFRLADIVRDAETLRLAKKEAFQAVNEGIT
ncbi:MAG: ATP-dependent DNA helicase RecG [Candidatus Omnitrophica bacterium]|nr:ATP-dependent DNA helicase RecG [Candidatus Omnitrophota bacterium]